MADTLLLQTTPATPAAGKIIATYELASFQGETNAHVAPTVLGTLTGSEGSWGLTQVSAANPLPISDAGGSLTVDGAVAATQSGTWDVDTVDTVTVVTSVTNLATIGTSVTPGTAPEHLGKVVDAAAGASDVGITALVVRDDALTTLTPADGDYTHLRVSSTGALHCTVGNTVTVTGSVSTSGSAPSTATLANVSTSTASATAQASNTNRLGLVIENDSDGTMYIKFGTTASDTSYTYRVDPQMSWTDPTRYTGRVDVILSTGTGVARVTELTA